MADLAERASHRLGWLAPAIDQRNATQDLLAAEHQESVDELASTLERIARDVRELAVRIRGLELSPR